MPEPLDYRRFAVGLFDRKFHFHILKHFSVLDDPYIKRISNNHLFTRDEILAQLKVPGSKFNPVFISNPDDLTELVFNKLKETKFLVTWKNNRCELELLFDPKKFPGGIGFDNLIPLEDLSAQERLKITERVTDYLTFKTIVKPLWPTWTIQLILTREGEKISILTIFPGRYAPVLPRRDAQTGEEFNNSKDFWENHVLIVDR